MRTRSLLACGAVAGPIFVGTYSVAGRVAADYDRRRDPVSALARTDISWVQTTNFVVSGTLMWAGARGLRRALPSGAGSRAVPALVAAAASGLLGAGLFATDTAEETAARGLSRRGALHVASAVPFFTGMPAAAVIWGARSGRDGRPLSQVLSVNAGALSLAAATVAGAGFGRTEGRLVRWAGFFQRLSVVAAFAWLSAALVDQRRRTRD